MDVLHHIRMDGDDVKPGILVTEGSRIYYAFIATTEA